MIHIEAAWLATEPLDMRAGTDTALARVVRVFGAAQPHHAYRIVMAPLTRSRAGEGDVATPLVAEYYRQRATAGLLITEASQISAQGKGYPRTPGIFTDAQIAGWKKVTDAVHIEGGQIFLQIWHVGRLSHRVVQPSGVLPVAPSAIKADGEIFTAEGPKILETPRTLDIKEIPGIVADFREAAENAKLAGFDGVEIHAANGYLIDQFLRDGTNTRTDAYGGSLENRSRFLSLPGIEGTGIGVMPGQVLESLHDDFLEVRYGGIIYLIQFEIAAEASGVPNPTLSRRISALEKTIGLRLLHRTTRKVELTEAGLIYFERCKRIVDEALLAHEQLGEMLAQPSGLLRASFPVDLAVTYLAPLVVEFASRYPGITFDFDLTPRRVDLVSEPFDIAIRTGKPENSQLIARLLAELPAYLYASPRYLERMGEPTVPADLERHECLSILKATSWTLHDKTTTTTVSFGGGRFALNSIGMIRRLATLDMGIILMPEQLVADDLDRGQLRRVLPQWQGESVPVYGITETRLLPAKTQRFIEFLRERLGKS